MKFLILSFIASAFLMVGTSASATGSNSNLASQIQAALSEQIDEYQDDITRIRAAIPNAPRAQRNRLRMEISVLRYRVNQLQCISRLVPRLPHHKLVWIANYLHLNVSTYSPIY